jgi:hypothetical protein
MRAQTRFQGSEHGLVGRRREQLVGSGFGLPLADRLARDGRYDLHGLIGLVENGCPPPLAVRILAPDDRDDAA